MCETLETENKKKKNKTCNVCGQAIQKVDARNENDYLHVKKQWNYFSQKDLTNHSFIVCETCYDKWIQSFTIPIEEETVIEVFGFTGE